MTKLTTLFSLTAVQSFLGITDDVSLLADAASEMIERQTGRVFVTRSITEVHNGDGTRFLHVDAVDPFVVTTLTVTRTEGGTPETIDPADFDVDQELGVIRLRSGAGVFTCGFQNVSVTYDAGYGLQDATTLPQDVYRAGLDLVRSLRVEEGSSNVSSVQFADQGIRFREGLPVHVTEVLSQWRVTRVA